MCVCVCVCVRERERERKKKKKKAKKGGRVPVDSHPTDRTEPVLTKFIAKERAGVQVW